MSFDPYAYIDNGDVCFAMHLPEATRTVRLTGAALVEYFGADGSEDALLDAYRANFRQIHAAAQLLGAEAESDLVMAAEDLRAAERKAAPRASTES